MVQPQILSLKRFSDRSLSADSSALLMATQKFKTEHKEGKWNMMGPRTHYIYLCILHWKWCIYGRNCILGDQAVFLAEIQIKIQRFQATMMFKVLLFRKPHYIWWSPFKHACNCETLFFLDLSQNYRCLLHCKSKICMYM